MKCEQCGLSSAKVTGFTEDAKTLIECTECGFGWVHGPGPSSSGSAGGWTDRDFCPVCAVAFASPDAPINVAGSPNRLRHQCDKTGTWHAPNNAYELNIQAFHKRLFAMTDDERERWPLVDEMRQHRYERYVEVQSWRLAARLARTLGPLGFRHVHIQDGFYDILQFGSLREDDLVVALNRNGSVSVLSSDDQTRVLPDWRELLEEGEFERVATRCELLLGASGQPVHGVRMIQVMSCALERGYGWRWVWAPELPDEDLEPYLGEGLMLGARSLYWQLRDEAGKTVALADLDGYLYLGCPKPSWELDVSFPDAAAAEVVTATFGRQG